MEAYQNRALALLNMQKADDALSDLETAIRMAPRVANLYRLRAYAYKLKGNAALAAADELKAAQIDQGRY